ncbi:MAG: ABC transporter permease [Candidatus Aminicenantales bacterium]
MKNADPAPDTLPRPPRLAFKIFKFFAGGEDYAFAVGDLEEKFIVIAGELGPSKARRWFFFEVLKAIPGFLRNAFYWRAAMIRNYLTIAWRHMVRSKLFTLTNLLGLSIGMACFILISLWIRDEKSTDGFHTNKERLYQVIIVHPDGGQDPNAPYALAPILADEYPEIASQSRVVELANIMTCSFSCRPAGRPPVQFYEKRVIQVDPSFFAMFSFPVKSGNPETALESPTSLVISEAAAEKYFGPEEPIGKTMTFNGEVNLKVSGVVRVPRNSHLQFDFAAAIGPNMRTNWNWADPSYVLLDPDVNVADLRRKIAGVMNDRYPQPLPGQFTVDLLPLTDSYLHFGQGFYVSLFSLIAAFILIIACVNFMNLATAASAGRIREVGLRKVVGARRPQLIQQFLGESLLISAIALVLSLALVRAFLGPLNTLTAKKMSFQPFQDPQLLIFLFGLIVAVALLSGAYPALFLSAVGPTQAVKASIRKLPGGHSTFRIVTVTAQFTASVLLIAGTIVIFRQLNFMRSRPLGLRTDHIIQIPLNRALLSRISALETELKTHPGVLNVTAGQAVPYDEDFKTGGLEWPGKARDLIPIVRYSLVRPEYLETFGIEILDGRSYSAARPADFDNYIINQAAARYMEMDSPVGQPLSFWGRKGTIIGIVGDFHQVSLHREIMPQIMTANPAFYGGLKYVFVKIRPDNIPETLAFIQRTFEKIAPMFPFESSFIDKGIDDLYASEQRLGRIFGYSSFLAIFISCLGIFGLASFTAEKRTKEIGIRKVLGASTSDISLLLSRSFARWLITANLIAWPVGWYFMHRWLERFAYRSELSPLIFLASGLISFLVAAVPVVYQSRRAASVDPVETLRAE